MALDLTPWFIGDPGAQHSAEVARLAANAPGGSDDGIFAPGDCKVLPLATPGSSVRIQAGAWKGQNRASSGRNQAFIGRVISDTNVAIAATGAGSGRSDLVCLVARDPSIPGSGGTVGGPYHQTLVVSGVPSTARRLQDIAGYENVSGLALARVTLPVSTATVQASHITDLRQLASPNTDFWSGQVTSPGDTGSSTAQDALTSPYPTFARWPNVATFAVPVPIWATHAIVRGTVSSYAHKFGSTTGRLRISGFGLSTPHVSFDENWDGNQRRNSMSFGGELAIDVTRRGTTQTINFDGTRSQTAGWIDADAFTNSLLDVTFLQRAV